MILKRLFPTRWARITAWTGAAITWVVTVLATQTVASSSTEPATLDIAPPQDPAVSPVTQPIEVIPTPPEDGLLIIRFTPAPPPPRQVITRTLVVGGGGASAPPGQTTVRSAGF